MIQIKRNQFFTKIVEVQIGTDQSGQTEIMTIEFMFIFRFEECFSYAEPASTCTCSSTEFNNPPMRLKSC